MVGHASHMSIYNVHVGQHTYAKYNKNKKGDCKTIKTKSTKS
jgi:hypothetical protein